MEIVFGAGAFNNQYEFEPELESPEKVLKYAFDHGITVIDTSAAYGPSEEILGRALAILKEQGVDRKSYSICSKCCRWETREFEFSRSAVNRSVERTLSRLGTTYLDVLYIHDVEFGKPDDIMEAVRAAFELKQLGKVRAVGVSGLPLDVLVTAAKLAQKEGTPLDAVLTYCNLTLQNDLLLNYRSAFEAAGVHRVLNASPLSMSLLRSRPTHGFHPASPELRECANQIGSKLLSHGIELADVATQYAFAMWSGPTVIGLRTIAEVQAALANREKGTTRPQTELWDEIIQEFGEFHNKVWEESEAAAIKPLWDLAAKSV